MSCNLQDAKIFSEFISCYAGTQNGTQKIHRRFDSVISKHRLTDAMLVRQMATLTRTVAHRSFVVTYVVYHLLKCALIVCLRVTNGYVACTVTTDSRRQLLECLRK